MIGASSIEAKGILLDLLMRILKSYTEVYATKVGASQKYSEEIASPR